MKIDNFYFKLFLMVVFSFVFGVGNVRGYELVESYAVPNFEMPMEVIYSGGISAQVTGLNAFNGYGKGMLYFNFTLTPIGTEVGSTRDIFEVKALNSNGSSFICDIGTINSYVDNSKNVTMFSVKCPVDLSSSSLTSIVFYSTYVNYQTTSAYIYMGDLLTFVTDNTYYNQLGTLINQLQTLVSSNAVVEDKVSYANLLMRDIITNIQWVKDSIDSAVSSIQDVKDNQDSIIDTDISDSDKEQPNQSDYNNYQSAENTLFDKMNYADTDDLVIDLDTNSYGFIWSTMISFFNSHRLIMSFIISLLSIGIIKLALGR